MTDETLQRLLRLKRHEHPQDMESFTENLLSNLHQRQRVELLKQSSVQLFIERLRALFDSLTAPQVGLAMVSALALIVGIVLMVDGRDAGDQHVAVRVHSTSQPSLAPGSDQLARQMDMLIMSPSFGVDRDLSAEGQRMSSLLLSKHFVGGYADEKSDPWASESILTRPSAPMEVMPLLKFDDADPVTK